MDVIVASPRALEALRERVWAIRPSALHALWATAVNGDAPSTELAGTRTARTTSTGSAVIPIHGPISRRPDLFGILFGLEGATTGGISASLQAALADPAVGRIVLDIDSPGGEVDGITELAAEIHAARAKKPIVAFVDTMAASAAYWLGSQASEIVITPSGEVGSIGVFALHVDRSRALDAAGITPTFIQAGKFKTEENPLQPLSDEAIGAIQERVDAFYGMFVRDVARGRGVPVDTVRSQFGEGRMVLAKDAVKRGMADRISDRIGPLHSDAAIAAEAHEALIFAAAHATVALSHR